MPAGGTRSVKRIVRLGQVRADGLHVTSPSACGPVTASTFGWTDETMSCPAASFLAPRQPVTITLPFSVSASPMASRLSLTASSMKPQVLTTTRSASL